MRQYRGIQTEHGNAVLVEDGAESGGLDPRFDLRNHSTSGFAWGYAGSGPAQKLYQAFKFRVIAHLPDGGWVLSEREVVEQLVAIERERDALRSEADEGPAPLAPVPPLTRRIDRQLAALAAHSSHDPTERLAVMRERGWMELVRHFAARGALTHAGRVEAGKLVAASEEWLREQRGEPAESRSR